MGEKSREASLDEVRTLLAAAGIEAPDRDLASLQRVLPTIRRRVERMYRVPTHDEVPAAVFRAEQGSRS